MKLEDLQKKSLEELIATEAELRKELAEVERSRKMGELKNFRKIRELKRNIARCLTLQQQSSNNKEEEK